MASEVSYMSGGIRDADENMSVNHNQNNCKSFKGAVIDE
jgi:hypothetical protein